MTAPTDPTKRTAKILIIGTGIAGLMTALKCAEGGAQVLLVCKDEALEGATRYAQGGIASVWSEADSFEQHKRDTLSAGVGLCREEIVNLCVGEGPSRVRELVAYGVPFTKAHAGGEDPAEEFHLHREGGHGTRRILHADDLTGLAIERTLLERVRAQGLIEVLEHHIAIDLITEGKLFKRWRGPGRALGAYVLDVRTGKVKTIASEATVLATGGAGKVYLYTSNPDTATGDGIAMAFRAGARVANMEFMQFHPTCLYHPSAKNSLISEALRGEGAVLRNVYGEEFMHRHHPQGALAPRDVAARAIDIEMKRSGDKHVLLDATALPSSVLKEKFPNINETCLKYGINITHDPIPVVPAAHYTCGGVLVGSSGETAIEGLYAVGEAACTGLHGANRLASNSLLEAVVFADRVSRHALQWLKRAEPALPSPQILPEWDSGHAVKVEERIDIAATWHEIRSLMWNYVGIVRSEQRLERARRRLLLLLEEVDAYYWDYLLTKDLIELRNILTVAQLMVQSAFLRKESRGLHFMMDYPETNDRDFQHDTVL